MVSLGILAALIFGQGQPRAQVKRPTPPTYGPGEHFETLSEGKVERTYTVHVPMAYSGKRPVPLVMLLHGWTSSAKVIESVTGMDALSDHAGFVLVVPDGLGKPQGWNCGFLNLGGADADDAKFLGDVLDTVAVKVKIDPSRIYVAGHSNGGMMAYVIGAKYSSRVAAIAVVSGTIGFEGGPNRGRVSPPTHPVSALIIHGVKDPTVPYNHGPGLLADCVSAPDSAAFWAHADGIDTPPTHAVAGHSNFEILDWKAGRLEVKLISIASGTQDWPGGETWDGRETKTGFDATIQIWRFFSSHPRR